MALSSDGRADDEELAPFRGGEEGAGIVEPRHWAVCDVRLTVVIVADFVLTSLLF